MRTLPEYSTPEGTRCPECGELCEIIALDNAYDYAGTHCTGGRSGTHYPDSWGAPVSDCCEAPMGDEVMDWDYAYEGPDDRIPFEEPSFI